MSEIKPDSVEARVSAMRQRRSVLDLDLDSYIDLKSKVISVLAKARDGAIDQINTNELNDIQKNLDYLSQKIILNAQMDNLNIKQLTQESSGLTTKINSQLVKLVDDQVKILKDMQEKINIAKEMLEKRKKLNDLTSKYTSEKGKIKLTKNEIMDIFSNESEADAVCKLGILVNKSNKDPSLYQYEFSSGSAIAFNDSLKELEKRIENKTQKCLQLESVLQEKRQKWEKLAEIIHTSLSNLTEQVKSIV